MKKYRSRIRREPWREPATGLSQEELARTRERMALYDSLGPNEMALVQEYGLSRALWAARRFYGRWAEARAYLEAERQALQIVRWESK
jgi:hypothetical protein